MAEKIIGHRRERRERAGNVELVLSEIVADLDAPESEPRNIRSRAAGVRHVRKLELPE